MKSKIVLLAMATAVLVLSSAAQAGLYVWDGSEADGNWDSVANWSTTGTTYTWPNEQFGDEYMNEDSDWVVLINGDTVNRSPGLSPDGARDGSNTCLLTLDNSSTLNIDGTVWVADHGNTKGRVDVLRGSRLTAAGQIKVGDDDLSIGTLNIIDGIVDIGSNLIIANRDGSTGYLNISGNSVIDIGNKFYMNDEGGGEASFSQVVMDSGIVTTAGNCYFNDDASNGTAYFTLNDGTWNSGGTLDVSWNLDGISHLTINDGLMTAATQIRLGVGGGGDTGESRIFLNGGKLLGEDLEFNMTDSQIVYTAGELWINGSALNEAGMQNLVDTGKILPTGSYGIITDGAYTVLIPEPATLVLLGLGGVALIRRKKR
ncbi:MAG: PEP-CTERM sorting domain-containing protein [Planctomycetes bacterium]|nr:PEP-CTERM sorting domain-containing protein [Planctomycetota bacterium]